MAEKKTKVVSSNMGKIKETSVIKTTKNKSVDKEFKAIPPKLAKKNSNTNASSKQDFDKNVEQKISKPLASAARSGRTITIKQVYSGAGKPKDQVSTLIGLGLNKINRISTLEDTSSVRGMVNKVSHLIKIIN